MPAKSSRSGTLTWNCAFSSPGMQPNRFFTAPVNIMKPCVFMRGRSMSTSASTASRPRLNDW